jgi:hypothetical protein
LRDQEKFAEACDVSLRAIAAEMRAVEASPKNGTYLGWLCLGYALRAETFLSQGKWDRSWEASEAALRTWPDSHMPRYYLAAAYARCLPRLEKQTKLSDSQRQALVRSSADRAVDLLRDAVKKGLPVPLLEEDPDLHPLRRFETFQGLVRELSAGKPP